ncbi:MAG: AAA family ATPase, partial [Clostridiales bacterium]|nr:AAA family ATPase [Clostridiales bacterium]
GLTANLASKVYKHYKERTEEVFKTNPYDIANNIDGVGFKTVDAIAVRIGLAPENIHRIKAGIKYVLTNHTSNGHVYYPLDLLTYEASELLSAEPALITAAVKELQVESAVVLEKYDDVTAVYLNGYFYAESYVAKKLLELNLTHEDDNKDYTDSILTVCKNLGINLAKSQMEAVKSSLKGGITVITGGPGTGKTTTINAIISMFKENNMDIVLAAPTGRAAKRMTEATGMEAATIHRLMEVKYVSDDARRQVFERNEENPIPADVLIIDEISMVDIMLMYHLLKAVEPGTRLILVGDADQLPSVGPGNVLKDIISGGMLKVVYLKEIFRQAQMSDIIVNAHNINNGVYPVLNGNGKDFFLVKRVNIDNVVSALLELVSERLPKFSGCGLKDIQVLTPMRKSKLGVTNLNIELQKILNPPKFGKIEYVFRDFVFREGDKVMQIKNNYNITWVNHGGNDIYSSSGQGVFNGDEGIIERINLTGESLTILFDDGRQADYDFSQLDEIEPAYAITIHKSQGSEYRVVVIPVHSGPTRLLSRNLLYTAVTRAREMVVLVGTEGCIEMMVDNDKEVKRYSALDRKMQKFGKVYESKDKDKG